MPSKTGETSAFLTSNLQEEEIWELGEKYVEGKRENTKPVIGRADIKTYSATKHNLSITSDEPPPKHVNISNWPEDKSHQKLIALEIAAEANTTALEITKTFFKF
jgi:hypothetical protein